MQIYSAVNYHHPWLSMLAVVDLSWSASPQASVPVNHVRGLHASGRTNKHSRAFNVWQHNYNTVHCGHVSEALKDCGRLQ
jgi:hypothetical protein